MMTIKKSDDELQVVWAEVYAPDIVDSQGDFMTEEGIRQAAWHFLKSGAVTAPSDVNHDHNLVSAYPVESFIARKGDPDFIPGSWVVGIHVADPALWGRIKKGELNGFSMEAVGRRVPREVLIDIPSEVRGQTCEHGGHSHAFLVKFDPDGNFLGGVTEPGPDGHTHTIRKGTATEVGEGHSHRFSFVELL